MKKSISKMKDKKHWYDGWFYDKFIAPNQDKLFEEIKNRMEASSSVIDIGCGTGRLEFQLADKVKKIIGVDLSSTNIEVAQEELYSAGLQNIEFIHADALEISILKKEKFDYAVFTFVIHELPEEERENAIESAMKISDKLIIGDYTAPQPQNIWRPLNSIIEYIAGKKHYEGYRSYLKHCGVHGLAAKMDLLILEEKPVGANTTLFVLKKNEII